MNVYERTQISGIKWDIPSTARAYRRHQEAPIPDPRAQETDILADAERQMAQFEAQHEATLREIAKNYTMPGDSSVQSFLRNHRTIPQLLVEAIPYLKRCFGGLAVVALRASIDESGAQMLYALVMWPGEVNHARQSLERFDDDWWIAHSRQASGYLSFSFELV